MISGFFCDIYSGNESQWPNNSLKKQIDVIFHFQHTQKKNKADFVALIVINMARWCISSVQCYAVVKTGLFFAGSKNAFKDKMVLSILLNENVFFVLCGVHGNIKTLCDVCNGFVLFFDQNGNIRLWYYFLCVASWWFNRGLAFIVFRIQLISIEANSR